MWLPIVQTDMVEQQCDWLRGCQPGLDVGWVVVMGLGG